MVDHIGLLGTAKGLVIYQFPESSKPSLQSIHFPGFDVNMVYVDERSKRWWVGLSHRHWGQKLHYTDDQGENWHESNTPSFKGQKLPNGQPASLKQIWSMASGGKDRPNQLWLGTDPGGLFKSEDHGQNFKLVEPLWNHTSRKKEGQWFGAGSDFPFIHSIVVDATDSDHVYIAVSCAGVFETRDGGATWNPKNNGLIAAYLPNPTVEVGHDPHMLLMSEKDPKIMWQQNHCGIFYTKDGGARWVDVSAKNSIPNYGFSMVLDHTNPGRVWVIPVESDAQRVAPGLKLQVYQTVDFGKTWKSDSKGLPREYSFDIVLRQSFAQNKETFLFGTTNGNLYYRKGKDKPWSLLTHSLAKVNSIYLH